MTDQDAINELRDRLGRAENSLSHGTSQFAELLEAVSGIKTHLTQQDERLAATYAELGNKLDAQIDSTESIVTMWKGGVTATRFLCRCARGWEWLMKQVFSKRFAGLLIGYVVIEYIVFHTLPEWTKLAIEAYKIYHGG